MSRFGHVRVILPIHVINCDSALKALRGDGNDNLTKKKKQEDRNKRKRKGMMKMR